MAQLLLRVTELVIAAVLLFLSIRDVIGKLRKPDSTADAWSTSIVRLSAGLMLIALASGGPHRLYPFAIIAVAIVLAIAAAVLRRRGR
jgi:hypothetical protein